MLRIATIALILSTLACVSALAIDLDTDTVDDAVEAPPAGNGSLVGNVAIVNTGDSSIGSFTTRLTGLGYTVATIPLNSGYATLITYEAVLLPVSHASSATIGNFQSLASDYIQYVADGGCLYIGQPNPWNVGGQQAMITWAPYLLRVPAPYETADCPPTIVAPQHCVTQGMQGSDLPFPGDSVLELGPEWTVLTRGAVTNYPGVIFASYGTGNVVVEFAHPNPNAICPYTNAGLDQMMSCCLAGGSTPVEDSTWGTLKAIYR